MSSLAHMRLLQIASPAFPIGGYSHSQGLEAAVEAGLVHDEASVEQWTLDVLSYSLITFEVPMFLDMGAAWLTRDARALDRLNDEFLAARESAELRSATVQMGHSMRALLAVLPQVPADLIATLQAMREPSLPCAWSGAAVAWSIGPADAVAAYLWSWAENQVLAAMKTVPIGQSSGQRILLRIGTRVAETAQHRRWEREGDTIRSNFTPGLAILASRHETQYSRLFRS
jgi:urease accessory protein